jgi:glycosyltransferase involved in cell wall biosynthesis
LLEAGACGLARIASRAGGNPEVVRDREDGLLVPYGDIAALRAAITELRDDEALRARLAGAAYDRARTFGFGEVADHWRAVLGTA